MRVIRPFPKELLKKMFLKVLYENKDISFFNSGTPCYNFISIICEILTDQFQVSELTEQEFNEIIKAVDELERNGYITKDSFSASSKIKVLTDKGKQFVENKLLNFKLPTVEIEKLITREDLKAECLADYLNGDYEISILKSFNLLEEFAKSIPVKPSLNIEKDKLSKSYISAEGILKEQFDEPGTDMGSLQRIMMGSMSWFKNPGAGKISNESKTAAQILLFVNLHLNVIDQKKLIEE